MIQAAIDELQARRFWMRKDWADTEDNGSHTVRLLDYACGGGTASKVSLSGRPTHSIVAYDHDRHWPPT